MHAEGITGEGEARCEDCDCKVEHEDVHEENNEGEVEIGPE